MQYLTLAEMGELVALQLALLQPDQRYMPSELIGYLKVKFAASLAEQPTDLGVQLFYLSSSSTATFRCASSLWLGSNAAISQLAAKVAVGGGQIDL